MIPARPTSTPSHQGSVVDQDVLMFLPGRKADSLHPAEAGPHCTVALTRYQDPVLGAEDVELRFSAEDFSPRWWPGQAVDEV